MTQRFLLLIFLFSFHSFADDCVPVNLVTEAESPFKKIPVYNQGTHNICYAYSAAQILDWYQLKNGALRRNVHPLWAALQYALVKKRDRLEIGHPKEAMESLRTSLNCDYDAVELAAKSLVSSGRAPSAYTPVDTLKDALQKYCPPEKRTFVMVPEVERLNYRTLKDDSSYEKFLSTKFATAPSPVSISYCANVWRRPNFDGIDTDLLGARDVVRKGCEYHESLVVGQKKIGNSCHFLIRNTWGSQWTSHNRSYACVCKNQETGEMIDDCGPETHGNPEFTVEACWIKGEDLARNIGQITFVK